MSFVLFALLIGAFTFLGLAVTAYVGRVGWVAVGFTAFFGALGFVVIVWQSPLCSKRIGELGSLGADGLRGYDSMGEKGRGGRSDGGEVLGNEPSFKDGRDEDAGGYTAAELTRVSWAMEPAVPPYTADLRRLRSIRGGQPQQDRRDWANYGARPYNADMIS